MTQTWRRKRSAERSMVPDAEFTSYYGRPVLKAAPWGPDIPAYLFLGGLASGSALLGAGADLTGRPALRRASRFGAAGGIGLGLAALVHDLGRPARALNMMRVAKPTSPMSTGTWLLALFGPAAAAAAASELRGALPRRLARLLGRIGRPAGLAAGALAPAVATYTAVLLADTATPTWHEAYRELPFVFAGSAASAAAGLGMIAAPTAEAAPARHMALWGAALDLAADLRREACLGLAAETLRQGPAGALMRASKILVGAGGIGSLFAGRSRAVAVASGAALMAGSAASRFGFFEAGKASARDPKYTVVPQRERLERRTR